MYKPYDWASYNSARLHVIYGHMYITKPQAMFKTPRSRHWWVWAYVMVIYTKKNDLRTGAKPRPNPPAIYHII
jgi:hypothetical protein